MNIFTVLAVFISYWQRSKAMKIQTPQFPRDPCNYNNDCWSMKRKSFGKMAILASSVSSSPLSDFQVLFAQFTRQTHCLLFARADVYLIQHLLLPSQDWGKSYCSQYFLFCLQLSTTSQGAGKRKDSGCFESYLFSSWKVIPCASISRTLTTTSCIL